jgi:hypothetical protein
VRACTGNLHKYIRKNKDELTWTKRVLMAIDIASAMAFLNKKNLIHRCTFPILLFLLLLSRAMVLCVSCRVVCLLLTPRLSCHAQRFEAGESPHHRERPHQDLYVIP